MADNYLKKDGKFDYHKWTRKNTVTGQDLSHPINLSEGKYFDSDIMKTWNSTKSIRKDLAQYIANAYEVGGEGDPDMGMDAVKSVLETLQDGITDGVKMVKKMAR